MVFENPGRGLGHALNFCEVKSVYVITTLPHLIIESLMSIQI